MKSKTLAVLTLVCSALSASALWVAALKPTAPPTAHLGLPADHRSVALKAYAAFPRPFGAGANQDNAKKNVRLWGPGLALNPGPQQTEDCVSWGGGHALQVREWVSSRGANAPEPSTEFLYGLARVVVGKHKPPCGQGGAYPTDLVQGLEHYGYLTLTEIGRPYSGHGADTMGCRGPTPALMAKAKVRAGVSAYPIRSIDEWRDAICNGYPVTVGIPWSPGGTRVVDGRQTIAFDGHDLGGHQICSIGYDGSNGRPYWFLYNSHGAQWPEGAPPKQGEPAGGCWVNAKWAQWIVTNGELWAISDIPGFEPAELDWSEFTASAPPRRPLSPPRQEVAKHVPAQLAL